ncbi:MAG: hypothetical protein JWO95_3200, partial [Verrucomicrobiales bacterium]|nr:hypothetical protein [Verrucomicrobiales bacterium]
SRGASFEHARGELVFGAGGQNEHGQFWAKHFDVAQNIDAAAAGHGDVENDDVPLFGADLLESFAGIGGFTDNGFAEARLNELLQSHANERVIVGDENVHIISVWQKVVP